MTDPINSTPKSKLYAGMIWILSAVALAIYGVLLFFNTNIPGIKELVVFLNTIDAQYVYMAAFVSIFVEGLYFIGSFFPGASLVLLLAILSQTNGIFVFLTTISLIFIGWSAAGIVNIYLAKVYRIKIIKSEEIGDYHVHDRVWTTWFPAFRASYEVAQITEGANPVKVFISSLRVRFWATLIVGIVAYAIPLFVDIGNVSNRESFITIIIVILISLTVGILKIKDYRSLK